eukprot:8972602-Prorocentrum_lima.AAC.1
MSVGGPAKMAASTLQEAFSDAAATIAEDLGCRVAQKKSNIIASSAMVSKLLVKGHGLQGGFGRYWQAP